MKWKPFMQVPVVLLVLWMALWLQAYWQPIASPMQKRFVAAKRAEAHRLAVMETNPVPSQVWAFFRAAERNDYGAAALIYDKLQESEYAPRTNRRVIEKYLDEFCQVVGTRDREHSELAGLPLATPMWETKEALRLFREPKSEWMRRLGEEIVATVSTNGIFLSGSDAGHASVLCVNGAAPEPKPFTTISVPMLADSDYLEYLRQTCSKGVQIPTPTDSQNAFKEYMRAMQQRMQSHP